MAEKVTVMVIKVDLDCEKCHIKIKKVLCKIPQIQNQVYDTKANTVTISVVCCSPEKIKKKICCKGGESVKGIEIKVPQKPKEPEKPKATEKPKEPEKPKTSEKPKEPEKPKEKPKDLEKPKVEIIQPPPAQQPKQPRSASPPKAPEPAPVYPNPRTCCRECYEGYGGGPCFHGFSRPESPCYGRPVYDSWGGGGCGCQSAGYYVCRCEYVGEDNRSGCRIM